MIMSMFNLFFLILNSFDNYETGISLELYEILFTIDSISGINFLIIMVSKI